VEILKERERNILLYIIEEYINQAEPVSSRSIAKKMTHRWGSATIRNVMLDLEKMGFLYKPHPVSGRVPTNKAFRYYIDRLNYSEFPRKKEVLALKGMLKPCYHYIEEVMVDASRTLAAISRYTSIVVEPKIDTMLFKEIEYGKRQPEGEAIHKGKDRCTGDGQLDVHEMVFDNGIGHTYYPSRDKNTTDRVKFYSIVWQHVYRCKPC